ncbi:snRNA-activating protein complex subunit 3 [Erpetoichthys calabaricus]|uniref:snRNA-activating protein complex subunit 3 n=1 Tax=Erpetoichthys calabaricus TaxID=27687 RepID=A0A8C4TIU5_ERPCA|nr:snRNA-activating protein complex subunit 3 [Erpetoichthys calabaricus]
MAQVVAESDCGIPAYEYQDINSTVFHVGTLAKLWKERLPADVYSFEEPAEDSSAQHDAVFGAEMALNCETVEEISTLCRLDTLKCYPEGESPDVETIPMDALDSLSSLRIRKTKQDYREQTISKDYLGRHENYVHELESHALGKKSTNPEDNIEEGELVLTVNILYPAIFQVRKRVKPHQTVMILGSQKLTQLRDAICCQSDYQITGEFSNTPDLAPEHISKDHFKSAFFYFDGVFYSDMRFPECRDLSKTIIDWTKSNERGYEKFQTARMENTTFCNLKIKVGYPYLYCHQGDCEHVVIFTDIRLAHRDDCRDKTMYPLLMRKHWVLSRKCFVCKMYIARWVTNQDSFAPADPCFFCDTCFRMLHYDKQGNKLGEFLAFPYVDLGTFN